MDNLKEYYLKHLISLLFSVVGTQIILFSAVDSFNILYCVISTIMITFYYYIFEKVCNNKNQGMYIYFITALVVVIIAILAISAGKDQYSSNYYIWILSSITSNENFILYELGSLFVLPFIFSSFTYYYSVNIFRMLMIVVISFIPRILYIKSSVYDFQVVNYIFNILIILMFIEKNLNKRKRDKVSININYKTMIIFSTMIVAAIFIFSFILPKPETLPKLPVLEGLKFGVYGVLQVSDNNNYRVYESNIKTTNESMGEFENKVLYSFTGDNPRYLIEKNYTIYKDNKWIAVKSPIEELKLREAEVAKSSLLKKIKEMSFRTKDYNPISLEISNKESLKDEKAMKIKLENISTRRIPHPQNVIEAYSEEYIDFLISDKYDAARNSQKTYFDKNEQFSIKYNAIEPVQDSMEDYLMRKFNKESFYKLLNSLEGFTLTSEIKEEYEKIYEVYATDEEVLSEEVKDLTKKLVSGSDSDYDSAKKIEEYLKSDQFTYSLNLPKKTGKEEYINYFISEGKTGYCVQYATAMTLMCRSLGIPARYVEGYSVSEKNRVEDIYLVTIEDGHAFVQVYLPGYGWEIFDPTPSITEATENNLDIGKLPEGTSQQNNSLNKINYTVILLGLVILILLIAILIFISRLYIKITKRPRFLRSVKKLNSGEALEELTKDSLELLKEHNILPLEGETLLQFAKRVDRTIDIRFSESVEVYYKYKYARECVNDDCVKEAFKINEELYAKKNRI